jgi:hypothetical protein
MEPIMNRLQNIMTIKIWPALLLALLCQTALAQMHGGHGGGAGSADQDPCVLRLNNGVYMVRLTGYQPDTRLTNGFCRNIPTTGHSIVVIDLLTPEMRHLPVGISLLRDSSGLAEQIRQSKTLPDLSKASIYTESPGLHQRGSIVINHDFQDTGSYLALLSVKDPLHGDFTTVIPFTVGEQTWMDLLGWLAGVIAVGVVLALLAWRAIRRAKMGKAASLSSNL